MVPVASENAVRSHFDRSLIKIFRFPDGRNSPLG